MGERWRLNRAGILNVYQYADETLHFGGGRLLLRGVNGSGKSTAMNMLLPFLLEADTRRIDAAGEQSAVLRSWMLSGRDEHQPIGYLWIEFSRAAPDGDGPSEYVVCGCGIKANRSTDRVTTWWFITDRRPGLDLALVENRVPLNVEALRATLGPHAVFAADQRGAYRSAVRNTLFGGRDLDQHIRLLHVVRSPRVGDRIDTDLTAYLNDALPQLSEAALDDAAQPLEDLEEHRRNVHELTRTVDTLAALRTVYSTYAATELRERAGRLVELADQVAGQQRLERRRHDSARAADAAHAELVERIGALDTSAQRLREEISALESSPAYQQGAELDDLREHVRSLERAVVEAGDRAERMHARCARAHTDARAAADSASDDLARLTGLLRELDAAVVMLRLPVRAPDAPAIGGGHGDADEVPVPAERLQHEQTRTVVGAIRAAGHQRGIDVGEVSAALDTVDRRVGDLVAAERERDRAAEEAVAAHDAFDEARAGLEREVATWRAALRSWLTRLDELDPSRTVTAVDATLADAADLLDTRHDVTESWSAAADRLVDHHRTVAATLVARRAGEAEAVSTLRDELDELQRRTYPAPPAAVWQRTDRRPVLADLIDFADGVTDADRCGLEAAMEAAGLLGAEVGVDGTLQLSSGELLVIATVQADAPLSRLLVVTVPAELQPAVDPGFVGKVLDSISTRLDTAADTVVAVDGTFRVGALRGRHSKTVAEHIGIAARRAAIERRRKEVAVRLREAEDVLARTDAEIDEREERVATALALRTALPSAADLTESAQRADLAERHLDTARGRHEGCVRAVSIADAAHADAVASASRAAATHQLPADRKGLVEMQATLHRLGGHCDSVSAQLGVLVRSHALWTTSVATWRSTVDDQAHAADDLGRARSELEPRAMRLATLEDAIGTEYADVLAALDVSKADLDAATRDLAATRDAKDRALETKTRAGAEAKAATAERETAEQWCVASLAPMRAALAVPGLLDAATDSTIDLPIVDESPVGVRQLGTAVLAEIRAPERAAVSADGVRQSLRQRRDQLGAGWDAEDHQPDEALPLAVQVTGPLGRMPLAAAHDHVRTQLDQQASLLTAKQDQALRNLLQGLVAQEVAQKMHAARELVGLMNRRLDDVTTAHGIGVRLTWRRRTDLDDGLADTIELLARPPDLRTAEHDAQLSVALSERIEQARRSDPDRRYRDLIGDVLDYRSWHEIAVMLRRPGRNDERLTRRTPLSEGEKKIVSYLPLFAAVAASYDALAESDPAVPRFVLLDDAFAKVSEDNHAQLFGLLVELDLDFIATSERLWGTHDTVPELAITEVLRDAERGVILLEHSRWDGRTRTEAR